MIYLVRFYFLTTCVARFFEFRAHVGLKRLTLDFQCMHGLAFCTSKKTLTHAYVNLKLHSVQFIHLTCGSWNAGFY